MSVDFEMKFLQNFLDALQGHLSLTLASVAIGIIVSIPSGVLAHQFPRAKQPLMVTINIIQTIPGLAILALVVAFLGGRIGFLPAFIALTLYSMLPIVRNTITGLEAVPWDVSEAAKGIGMSRSQRLILVELPLAKPVIIAGLRTAIVWTAGMATLATLVGAPSFGNYIFTGLQTRNLESVLLGSVASAALALILDAAIGLYQKRSIERTRGVVGKRSFFLLFYQFFVVMVLVLAIATIFWPAKQVDVVVGAKGYTEQHVLAGLLSAELNRAGFKTEQKIGLGSQVIFEALRGNSIDVYFEYSGTVWAGHMSHEDNPGPEVIREAVERYVESQGVYFVGFGGFENRYALAMRRDRAEALGVTSITDLAGIGESMKAGGDLEFFGRLEWIRTNQIYGVDFDEKLIFDSSMMYGAVASGEVDVISAYTTDGRIAAYDLLILDDPNNAMLSYDAMLLSSDRITKRPGVMRVLARLANRLTDANMREANRMVDVDGLPVSTAVAFLQNTVNFHYKSD